MSSVAVVQAGDVPDASVRNLLDQDTLKWVFVGGKGGVGKTTCSSIVSILLASVRSSVLVISTDPAHNLSDAFQQRFTKFPTLVKGFSNLYAMVIFSTRPNSLLCASIEMGKLHARDSSAYPIRGGRVMVGTADRTERVSVNYPLRFPYFQEIDPKVENDDFGNEGMEGFISELTNAIPGVDEAMSFAEMLKLVQTMDYSVVVFDTAPTGHTLRLLQFPATLEKGLEKMMDLKNRFGGLINQATRLFGLGDELNEDAMLGRIEGMKDVIEQVNRQFKDPDLTTFVCVCIPEFLSLYETERLVQELAKFEIDAHNIIINQVIFDEEAVESKLLKARVKMQQKYVDQFHMLYDDFNITKLPLLPEEVCGVQALQNFSKHFLAPYTPTLRRGSVEELEERVSTLKSSLQVAEAELDRVRKGKQVA